MVAFNDEGFPRVQTSRLEERLFSFYKRTRGGPTEPAEDSGVGVGVGAGAGAGACAGADTDTVRQPPSPPSHLERPRNVQRIPHVLQRQSQDADAELEAAWGSESSSKGLRRYEASVDCSDCVNESLSLDEIEEMSPSLALKAHAEVRMHALQEVASHIAKSAKEICAMEEVAVFDQDLASCTAGAAAGTAAKASSLPASHAFCFVQSAEAAPVVVSGVLCPQVAPPEGMFSLLLRRPRAPP